MIFLVLVTIPLVAVAVHDYRRGVRPLDRLYRKDRRR